MKLSHADDLRDFEKMSPGSYKDANTQFIHSDDCWPFSKLRTLRTLNHNPFHSARRAHHYNLR